MKTKIKLKEPTISEDIATLSPPAKVNLPALTHKIVQTSIEPVESLHDIARRISQIPPTVTPSRKVDRPRKTRISPSSPKVKPKKKPEQKVYQRLSRAFD